MKLKKIIINILTVCLLIGFLPASKVNALDNTILATGNFGIGVEPSNSITYTIYSNGVMELEGTGATFNCNSGGAKQPFKDYRNLVTTLKIGEGITNINVGSFSYFTKLEKIEWPSTLTTISMTAFMGAYASHITKITIPETITKLSGYSFGRRYSSGPILSDVIIKNPNIEFSAPVNNVDEQGTVYSSTIFNSSKYLDTLNLYSYGKENNVSKYADSIGATYYDLNTYQVGSIQGLDYEYYDGVLKLSSKAEGIIPIENQPWLNEKVQKDDIRKIILKEGIKEIPTNAFKDYVSLLDVELNEGLLSIEDGAFSTSLLNHTKINIKIPNSVTYLGNEIFRNRSQVKLLAYSNTPASSYLEEGVSVELIKKFRILLIGNSFSLDASNHGQLQMLDIFEAMMGKDCEIEIGVYYNGGRTVAWHASKARNGEKAGTFAVLNSETRKWNTIGNPCNVKMAFDYADWDVVTIQPHGSETTTGIFDNSNTSEYHADEDMLDLKVSIPYMLDYIHKHDPQAKVYYYLSWPTSYKAVMNSQEKVFEKMIKIAQVAQYYTGENKSISGVIPAGTAIQTAYSTYLGNLSFNQDKNTTLQDDIQIGLTRDSWHVSYNIGRYIVALVFANVVLPKEFILDEYELPNISDSLAVGKLPSEYTKIAQLVVEKAIESIEYENQFAHTRLDNYQINPIDNLVNQIQSTSFEFEANDQKELETCLKDKITSFMNDDFKEPEITINSFEINGQFSAQIKLQYGYTIQEVNIQGKVKEKDLFPEGWAPVPYSITEDSNHLGYKIEDGILTFKDFGDASFSDYGKLPDYTNTNEISTKYNITEWYERRNEITKVIFDESISTIGTYTLVWTDNVEEIVIENKETMIKENAVVLNVEYRNTPLRIYATSTIQTIDNWIRGSYYRKLTQCIVDSTMFYTDLMNDDLAELEECLLENKPFDQELLFDALQGFNLSILENKYTYSDYKISVQGAERTLEFLKECYKGNYNSTINYKLNPISKTKSFELVLSGQGTIENFKDVPWREFIDCITDVKIDDNIQVNSFEGLSKDVNIHTNLNSDLYELAVASGMNIKIDTLRLLLIGNSHTADYSEFLSNILKDLKEAGLETKIIIDRNIIGSMSLFTGTNSNAAATYHSQLEHIQHQSGAYNKLKSNTYDLIIVQDYMESCVESVEVFEQGLANFINTIRTIIEENGHGHPQIAWFADWVDIRGCGGDTALNDGKGNKVILEKLTREQVYQKSLANISNIESNIQNKVDNMPDFVIHGSTFKQNAMSSYLGTSTMFENNYSLIERDTTHLSYELGRYLFGAGVMSEIINQYKAILKMSNDVNVGQSLSLKNGPVANGSTSQYTGNITKEILDIIREVISSPNEFKQSIYTVDPTHQFVNELKEMVWELDKSDTQEDVLNKINNQIPSKLKELVSNYEIKIINFTSIYNFTIQVYVSNGYTILKSNIIYFLGDVNNDLKVNQLDRVTLARYLAKWNGYDMIHINNADVNLDGKVNQLDRLTLSRYLAKWQGYESLPKK